MKGELLSHKLRDGKSNWSMTRLLKNLLFPLDVIRDSILKIFIVDMETVTTVSKFTCLGNWEGRGWF